MNKDIKKNENREDQPFVIWDDKKFAVLFMYGEPLKNAILWDRYLKVYRKIIGQTCEEAYFDKSFRDYEIEDFSEWFSGYSYLTKIYGIENINARGCLDFSSSFANCSNIIALDLSSLNLSQGICTNNMFSGCDNLKYLRAGKQIINSESKIPPQCINQKYLELNEIIARSKAAAK